MTATLQNVQADESLGGHDEAAESGHHVLDPVRRWLLQALGHTQESPPGSMAHDERGSQQDVHASGASLPAFMLPDQVW